MASQGTKRQSSFADRVNVPRQNVKHVHVNSVKLQQKGSSIKKAVVTNQQKSKSENFNKDLEDKFRQMLQGNMDNLPNLPRSVARIFISSTFSDMRAERNILSREVFPKLKQLCLSKDLDFQVVDMRWGITEDSQNDHSVEKICLQEVENCQKLSLGPNFVPISSQFSFFADFSPGCDEHRARHTKEWNTTLTSLQKVLRDAALEAFHSKKFTEAQVHEYFYSVTEIEIQKGILSSEDPASQTAVFCREITGFSDFDDTLTMRFIDTVKENGKNNVNSEVRKLQNELKKKLETKTKLRHSHTYKIDWNTQGIGPEICKEHEEYLKKFCKDFYDDFSQMIDNALDKRKSQIRRREFRSQFPEILHHLHFCETKCKTFCGQETILNTAKNYILNTSMNKPFVVHAPSGNGKTSVMAMIMKNLRTWLKDDNFVGIIRFLGTSGLCLNVYDVLVNLVKQLSDVSGIRMEPIGYQKMKNLLEYFPRFIRRVANTLKKPVIILLDSIDQLSREYDAHSMKWLPMTLPPNIKIIISTLPNEFGILESIRALSPDSNYYLEISDLPLQTGKEMMEKYLLLQNRSLLHTQEKVLMNAFLKCPSPLFLKLSVDEAMKWKSYTEEHHLILQETVQGAINKLFDNLEVKFGPVVTGHALGYITIVRDGISENELEDVLSCDDEALNDVYRYHNPPIAGIVRIPPVLVARIKYDIREYLVERLSQDKYTMNWYHRQFTESAEAKYSSGAQGEVLQRNLAEIFMCETSVKRDITLTRRKLTISNADRQVTGQPVSEHNKRMLFCLPYHIIHARTSMSLRTAKDKCFCNFNFIYNKLAAFSADVFVSELNEFLQFQEDQELKKLRDFFVSLTNDVISPKRLAISLLEYVSVDTADISLQKLLSKAEDFLKNQSTSTLIPLHPGQAPRKDLSEAITSTFTGIDNIVSFSQGTVLVKDSPSQNEDVANSSYKVYFENAEELMDVDVPFIKREEHQPIVDSDGQYVIYTSPGSVTCLNLIEKCQIERQFQHLCTGGSKQGMVCKRISANTNYLAVLFENGVIIELKIVNLEEINRWSLSDKTADVLDMISTETEHLLVLLATHNGSELLVYSNETKYPKRYYFDYQLCNNCWGLSKAECLFSVLGNKGETTCTIESVDFSKGKTRTPIDIQDRLKYISCSESTSLVCCWGDECNVVVALDLEKRKSLFRVTVSNPVTCATLCGGSFVLIVGEEDGTISLYDSVTGNPCASVKAHEGKVQQLVMLDDFLISHGKNKIWKRFVENLDN
ncbi:NACHT domain- and WD repeat-containing protein 1-like [Saccostrea echinata]|uniref:NACHT domain- and WD repeat-containing protein 1-like n=1 Tax=Saccostrea echinata TaxID=191078 RepID=UPI002A81EFDE|nr:NACHT domain- and WD repeat-containing protein 1-like [Saccostrea echinata]